MQFKPITVTAVLLLVVASLLVTGCTTSNTPTVNQTTSPPNVTTPTSIAGDLSHEFNEALKDYNYTLVVPFTRAVNQYGNWVYTAVAKDGEEKLVPFVHNVTIEEIKNRNDSLMRFNAYVAQAVSNGYLKDYSSSGYWNGKKGSNSVSIQISEPNKGIYTHVFSAPISSPSYYIISEYSKPA